MGAIEITRARQTLGNLPGVREADVRTGGELIGRGLDALGRGVSEFGRGLARVGAVLGKEADEEIDREADDIANAYRSDVMDLSVEQMSQPAISDTEKWLNDTITSRTKIWNELTKDKSSRSVERAQRKLAGFDLDMKTRWQNHAKKIGHKNAVDSANASVESTMRAMEEPPEDPDAAVLKWDDCNSAMNKVLSLNGVTDPEAIKIEKRKAVERILQSRIARPLTLDPDNTNGAWPDEETLAPDKILDTFIPDAPQEARSLLSDEDLQHISAAAKKDLRAATERSKARVEAAKRQERQELIMDFSRKELEMRDAPEEQWPTIYDDMGHDPKLKELDPVRARNYVDTARELRAAAKAKKERDAEIAKARSIRELSALRQAHASDIKNNENDLAGRFEWLQIKKMENAIEPDKLMEEQSEIWRDFLIRSQGGNLSTGFMSSFRSRFATNLTEQEKNAMRIFYNAFGFHPELSKDGEPTSSARKAAEKDSTDYYAPHAAENLQEKSRDFYEISASEILKMGDVLLKSIRAEKPGVNREALVESTIKQMKTRRWKEEKVDANIKRLVESVVDVHLNYEQWLADQHSKQNTEKENGNNKDSNSK